MMALRSLLFVPTGNERRMEKALSLDADGVVFDLEDAVAISEKPAARASLPRWTQAPRTGRLYVRVNGLDTPFGLRDLEAVATPGVDGIILPKAESACDVRIADWVLTQCEQEQGLAPGGIEILPLIETARGLDGAREVLSASPRVLRAGFGAGDWCADTGMAWTTDSPGLAAARFRLAVHSRACERQPPIDTAFIDVRDETSFAAEATLAADLGFQGKFCIHPVQVAHANRIFAPSAEEVERAREIWSRFVASEADGIASVIVDDRFVDYPVAAQARAVLERAGEHPAPRVPGGPA